MESSNTIRRTAVPLPLLDSQIDDNAVYEFSMIHRPGDLLLPTQPQHGVLRSVWSTPPSFQALLYKLESDAPIPPAPCQFTGAQIRYMRAHGGPPLARMQME
jgi:hypothetical protein